MMFIIDWIFDKMGYTQKASLEFPIAKPVTVKPARKAVKKVVRKTVRKKA